MYKKAFIVTGLGYGDEGKGSIVDWLTMREKAHTVIRTGGPQALHRVVTGDGREHVFQQFGSGTLRGAATHLSRAMLVAPSALLREGALLQKKCRRNVFDHITLHKDALIVTPVQAVTGRVRELLRGADRRGSVGVGVGETVRDAQDLDAQALRAQDLYAPNLPQRLTELWQYKLSQYEAYADRASGLPEPMGFAVRAQLAQLADGSLLTRTIEEFAQVRALVRIVDDTFLAEEILARSGTIVCEGSQGVLLDRVYGFYPYTTKVRSVPDTARELLRSGGYAGEVKSLGITRSYSTRHGHGPFVTEDATLTEALPDAANHTDQWQGNFRVGHFDAVSARYAIAACGPHGIDGLVLTCVDRTRQLDMWHMCIKYQYESIGTMKTVDTILDLKQRMGEHLSDVLVRCQPILNGINHRPLSEFYRAERHIEAIEHALNVPIYAVSCGAHEHNKSVRHGFA